MTERLPGDPPSPWEGRFGFSRIVKTRGFVLIGGTTAVDEVGRAHGEVFAGYRPLLTMVEGSALIDPRMLVEIEVVALAPE